MRLTDKEGFIKCLGETRQDDSIFTKIDKTVGTYFCDVDFQPDLIEYDPNNLPDMRSITQNILTEEKYSDIKRECLKIFAKNMLNSSLAVQEK